MLHRNVELLCLKVCQHFHYKECFQKFFILEDILLFLSDSAHTHFYHECYLPFLCRPEKIFSVAVPLVSALRRSVSLFLPAGYALYVHSPILSLTCFVGWSSLLFRIFL